MAKKPRTIDDLNEREIYFCEFYTALGEETCGNQRKSAIKAGYSEKGINRQTQKLMKRPAIKAMIRKIHKERMDNHMINPERVLFGIEHGIIMAQEKGDVQAYLKGHELMGKHLAMFKERFDLSYRDEPPKPLSPEEQAIYQEAAHKATMLKLRRPNETEEIEEAEPVMAEL